MQYLTQSYYNHNQVTITINKNKRLMNQDCEYCLLNQIVSKIIFTLTHEKEDKLTIQQAFTCSKLTIETLEQGVKYVQS